MSSCQACREGGGWIFIMACVCCSIATQLNAHKTQPSDFYPHICWLSKRRRKRRRRWRQFVCLANLASSLNVFVGSTFSLLWRHRSSCSCSLTFACVYIQRPWPRDRWARSLLLNCPSFESEANFPLLCPAGSLSWMNEWMACELSFYYCHPVCQRG